MLCGAGSNRKRALGSDVPNGFSPIPGTTVSALRHQPLPIGVADRLSYAASSSSGSLYFSPRVMMAQAIQLSSAGAHRAPNHGRFFVPCFARNGSRPWRKVRLLADLAVDAEIDANLLDRHFSSARESGFSSSSDPPSQNHRASHLLRG